MVLGDVLVAPIFLLMVLGDVLLYHLTPLWESNIDLEHVQWLVFLQLALHTLSPILSLQATLKSHV